MIKPSVDVALHAMQRSNYSVIDAVALLFAAQYTLLLGLFDDRRDEVIDHMRKTLDEFEAAE
jgi:hypothetical protein